MEKGVEPRECWFVVGFLADVAFALFTNFILNVKGSKDYLYVVRNHTT